MITFWAAALALTLLLYIILDGFDLGVGILFGIAPNETARRHMMQSISPIWDGNETWLVLSATILFGAFPLAYALLMSAFYLPLLFMLAALILRGVAFEFRYKSRRLRRLWDIGFSGGSLVAAFMQGMTVGTLVQELPVRDGRYIGSALAWLSPFALLCGAGLCLGYALLGASWLTLKTQADVRDFAYRMLPRLLGSMLLFLTAAFGYTLFENLRVLHKWFELPAMLLLPLAGLCACTGLMFAVWRRIDWMPFVMSAIIFSAAFATLAASFLPYIVPFRITIGQAAAPLTSLSFMFWGAGIVVLPITLIYTLTIYWIFKGKVSIVTDEVS